MDEWGALGYAIGQAQWLWELDNVEQIVSHYDWGPGRMSGSLPGGTTLAGDQPSGPSAGTWLMPWTQES